MHSGLRYLSVGAGTLACSLLAPSDEEFLSGNRVRDGDGSGGARAPAPASGAGGLGRSGGGGGSALAGGSGLEGGVYPLLPMGGNAGRSPSDADLAPPSPPDAGFGAPLPCVDCETIRITSGAETVLLGGPGGSLHMEICPYDRVVVGMDYRFTFGSPADFGYLTSVAVVCGELVPKRSSGSIEVVIGEPLAPRGAGAGASGAGGRCPLGQVVTGFEGARNFDASTSALRELTPHCAPLTLSADASLAIGQSAPAPPLSADFAVSTVLPSEVMPLQLCPAGQVARGAVVRAGAWVDGIGFVCGTPVLALPEGDVCGSALECQSGRCEETCQPRPCTPPAGCSCGLRESTEYAFCEGAQTRADAAERCAAAGMHLAYADDPIAHGWLRGSAVEEGIQAAFWLGADDLLSEGSWQWVQGAGAVDLDSELWDDDEQRGGASENCLEMTRDGHWDDVDCALALPFVCEAPSP